MLLGISRKLARFFTLGICTLALLFGLTSITAQPANAEIRTIQEAENQILYQTRTKLYDRDNNIWQAIAFKRIAPDVEPAVKVRLVGFPGKAELAHPKSLKVFVPGSKDPLEAPDISAEPFPDKKPKSNVGQYDLTEVIPELPQTLEVVLKLPTKSGSEVGLAVSPLTIQEWKQLAKKS
jgi:hypothetical protein